MIIGTGASIHVAEYKVDMRKGHQGLLAEAYLLKLDPWKGDIIIFPGTCRRRVKVLLSDRTGLWVNYKLFCRETMKTQLRFLEDKSVTTITSAELALLLDGSAYVVKRKLLEWNPTI